MLNIKNNVFANLFNRMFGNSFEEHLYVESCTFVREGSNCWEEGLLADSGDRLIDMSGQDVGDVEDISITEELLVDVDNMVNVYVDDLEGWQLAELGEQYKSSSSLEKWRMQTINKTNLVRYIKPANYPKLRDGCGYLLY